MGSHDKRHEVEYHEQWREICGSIPFLQFPADWEVRMIPPFGGCIARFKVRLPSGLEKSIYLDWFDTCGCVGKPYWEVYPYHGDCGRALLHDTELLMQMIKQEDGAEEKDE